jgi:hydroxymethylbilane synthase
MRIRLSSRKSDLARLQTQSVKSALIKAFPSLDVTCSYKESLGDVNLTDPLWKIPEKGVFTEDFQHDLLQVKTDAVVHSWKDLPTEAKDATYIVATSARR